MVAVKGQAAVGGPSGVGGGRGKSAKERLGELKELLDADLISQAEFDAQRTVIIQSL